METPTNNPGMLVRTLPSLETCERNRESINEFLAKQRRDLNIVQETRTLDLHCVDWIRLESQGDIAQQPPSPPPTVTVTTETHPNAYEPTKPHHFLADDSIPTLMEDFSEHGREGTVPVFRHRDPFNLGTQTLDQYLSKHLPPAKPGQQHATARGAARESQSSSDPFTHHWAGSYQDVKHFGCNACYSCFRPWVQAEDSESLIQTGVLNINKNREMQAIEVGWQVLPQLYGDYDPHLFIYYRTKGSATGDHVGGYNRLVKGWVQVDTRIMPGSTFRPWNVRGDEHKQCQINIAVQLFKGNWWVWVQGKWIGYYPGSLFSAVAPGASDTLAHYGNRLGFWGEVANWTETTDPEDPTTDMGSGYLPGRGFGWSAYINNISYFDTPAVDHAVLYDGSKIIYQARPEWYGIWPHFTPPNTRWGSYLYVGGPGGTKRAPPAPKARPWVKRKALALGAKVKEWLSS